MTIPVIAKLPDPTAHAEAHAFVSGEIRARRFWSKQSVLIAFVVALAVAWVVVSALLVMEVQ